MNLSDHLEVNAERAAGDVIDGEAIIINLETGVYYSMQGIGGDVWSMIAAQRSFGSMLDAIVAAYDVTAEDARRDLEGVVGQLLDEGLVRFGSETRTGVSVPHEQQQEKKPYAAPQLQIYRDMQDLLALDPPAPGMNQIAWDRK
jgi:hypothetical protein